MLYERNLATHIRTGYRRYPVRMCVARLGIFVEMVQFSHISDRMYHITCIQTNGQCSTDHEYIQVPTHQTTAATMQRCLRQMVMTLSPWQRFMKSKISPWALLRLKYFKKFCGWPSRRKKMFLLFVSHISPQNAPLFPFSLQEGQHV